MDSNVPICCFNIRRSYQSPWAILSDHLNNLINSDVLEHKILRVNTIINATTSSENKSTINHHLPCCPRFGITPKLLICRRRSGGEIQPATLPRDTSLAKYSSMTFLMLKDREIVLFGWLYDIRNLLLVRMAGQFLGKFIHFQRSNCRED